MLAALVSASKKKTTGLADWRLRLRGIFFPRGGPGYVADDAYNDDGTKKIPIHTADADDDDAAPVKRSGGFFEYVMILVLIVSVIIAAIHNPLDYDCTTSKCRSLRVGDFVVTLCFAAELVLRFVCYGWRKMVHPIRILDLVLILINIGTLVAFFSGAARNVVSLNVVRLLRVLQPMFAATKLEAVRVMVYAVRRTLRDLADVALILVLFLCWMSVAGVHQFGGALSMRCVADAAFQPRLPPDWPVANSTVESDASWLAAANLTLQDFVCGGAIDVALLGGGDGACSADQTCSPQVGLTPDGQHPSQLGGSYVCPVGYSCARVRNAYEGFAGFDNIAQSFLSVFIAVTLQGYSEYTAWAKDATDSTAWFFFVFVITVGTLLLVNLTVVILTVEFEKSREQQARKLEKETEAGEGGWTFTRVVQELVRHGRRERAKAAREGREADLSLENLAMSFHTAAAAHRAKRNALLGIVAAPPESSPNAANGSAPADDVQAESSSWSGSHTDRSSSGSSITCTGSDPSSLRSDDGEHDDGERGSHGRDETASDAAGDGGDLTQEKSRDADGHRRRSTTGGNNNDAVEIEEDAAGHDEEGTTTVEVILVACDRLHDVCERISDATWFSLVTGCVVVLNLIVLCVMYYGMPDWLSEALTVANIFFTAVFTAEAFVLFMSSDSIYEYATDPANVVDVFVLVVSYVEILAIGVQLPAVRALRTARALKLVKFFPSVYTWLALAGSALKVSPLLFLLIALLIVIVACLTMQTLGGIMCAVPSSPPTSPAAAALIQRALRAMNGENGGPIGIDGSDTEPWPSSHPVATTISWSMATTTMWPNGSFVLPHQETTTTTVGVLGMATTTAVALSSTSTVAPPTDIPSTIDALFVDAFVNNTYCQRAAVAAMTAGVSRLNFDSFSSALVAAYAMVLSDSWHHILFDAMFAGGAGYAVPFILFEYVSNFVLLHVIIAIFLTAHSLRVESRREGADAALMEATASSSLVGATVQPGSRFPRSRRSAVRMWTPVVRQSKDAAGPANESSGEYAPGSSDHVAGWIDPSATSPNDGSQQRGSTPNPALADGGGGDRSSHSNTPVFAGLTPLQRLRIRLQEWIESSVGNAVITANIAVCSMGIALQDPIMAPDASRASALRIVEIGTTSLFVAEMSLCFFSYGVASGGNAYLRRNRVNVLDFALVVASVAAAIVCNMDSSNAAVACIRVIAAARPLRLIGRFPTVTLVVDSTLDALVSLRHVVGVLFVTLLMYGVIGVFFFSGALQKCYLPADVSSALGVSNDPDHVGSLRLPVMCPAPTSAAPSPLPGSLSNLSTQIITASSSTIVPTLPTNDSIQCYVSFRRDASTGIEPSLSLALCTALGGQYMNDGPHFDNIGAAALALFQVLTLVDWTWVMVRMSDAVGVGQAPRRGANTGAAYAYVCVFTVVGGIVLLSLFASTLIAAFNRAKRFRACQLSAHTSRQFGAWRLTEKRILKLLGHREMLAQLAEQRWRMKQERQGHRTGDRNPRPLHAVNHDDASTMSEIDADSGGDSAQPSDRAGRGTGAWCRARLLRALFSLRWIMRQPRTSHVIAALIAVNFVFMAARYYPSSASLTVAFDDINLFFTILFAVEMALKLLVASTVFSDTDNTTHNHNDRAAPLLSSGANDDASLEPPGATRGGTHSHSDSELTSGDTMDSCGAVLSICLPSAFMASKYNQLDLFVTIVSSIGMILQLSAYTRVAGIFLSFRVVRLARYVTGFSDMVALMSKIRRAIPSLAGVFGLAGIFYVVFATMGMKLFGRMRPWPISFDGVDGIDNFSRVDLGFMFAFRITVGGDWPRAMYSLVRHGPDYDCLDRIGNCGPPQPVPQVFFAVFVFSCFLILRYLFTAALLDSFASSGLSSGLSKAHTAEFCRLWTFYDRQHDGHIGAFDVLHLIRALPPDCAIGFDRLNQRGRINQELKLLVDLRLLDLRDTVPLDDVIDVLCRFSFDVSAPSHRLCKQSPLRDGPELRERLETLLAQIDEVGQPRTSDEQRSRRGTNRGDRRFHGGYLCRCGSRTRPASSHCRDR